MNITFFELEKWEEKEIQQTFKGHKLAFSKNPLTARNAAKYKNAEAIAVFIYSKIDEAALALLPKLKFIATMSTGFDHIDLEACKKRGISVSTVPYYGENTVAEHTFALLLSLSRKIPQSVESTRLHSFSLSGLMGFDLKGKTLGVIGCGHIGQHVIRIAKGFAMNVIAYDVKKDARLAKKMGFSYGSLDKVFQNADVITLHVPYNKYTHHILNKDAFKKMKKGVYIINTARGNLIDTTELVKALASGHVAGAGLDVLEGERMIKEEKEMLKNTNTEDLLNVIENNLLLKNKKVLITPHSAFYSKEALHRILHTTVDNINGYMKKRKINLVS